MRRRIKEIIAIAIRRTNLSSLASWLRLDEHGFWESTVRKHLRQTSDRADELGLKVKDVNLQIAEMVILEGTETLLRDAKRRQRYQSTSRVAFRYLNN